MLTVAVGDEGRVVTVYSRRIRIGGLTRTSDDSWHWALFCLRGGDLQSEATSGMLGGTEQTMEAAMAALRARWQAWLDEAGLVFARPSLSSQTGFRQAPAAPLA